jgi:putative tricarboxylic transport membrane protein
MRRAQFIASLGALAASVAPWPLRAQGLPLRMMLPATPGGGWDTTGRALGRALQEAGVASAVSYENKGGAAGAIGLAQFVETYRGDPHALMVMGAVMLGGSITGKPPVSLDKATPIARLTSEYNLIVVPADSPFKSLAQVLERLRQDPAGIKWGGGSRGATEHIVAAMIARAVGVDPARINYVAFRGGGEAIAAILGGNVTIGGSSASEFMPHIRDGRMRALAITAEQRRPGLDVPTLREQGVDVVLGNWRGVYGAPAILPEQRQALVEMVALATRTRSWTDALARHGWMQSLLTGPAFEKFVDDEFAKLRGIMVRTGLV